jgi:hypothetical protein
MEEKGHIILKFDGIINGEKLTPSDIDISEIKEIITDIEAFLYPTRSEKNERPHISYRIEDGSALHKFFLPLTSVLFFNGIIGEVNSRKTIDFLDFKRAEIIEKFQRVAKEKDLEITFSTSSTDTKELKITKETNYFNVAPNFIYSEFTLYGEIYQEGGITPNLHINTKEFGKLTVSATKEQILEGEKRVYKIYGLKATGKQSLENMKPYDLKLNHFINYNPVFDKAELDILIAKATPNLSKIENVDNWLTLIREGGAHE